ncbi:hypothetical protein QBC46DRAFT_267671 [Diplogelasinospora grovesii]|uniref:Uncharacterized protein n=1 Tax=Diplogelasinospora grovesii TaxID=303347 RepID=A0AAN6N1D5_9PEZI|nr:hypothetical protein QBC46DRAFT_267671 [Diplogelasinospora grovesii]
MPPTTTSPHPSTNFRRGSHASTSSLSDDEDAITACPLKKPSLNQRQHTNVSATANGQHESSQQHSRPHSQRSNSWRTSISHFDPPDSEGDGCNYEEIPTELLWRRMLTIQRMFGCYNSARMRAALEAGAENFVPSRTCLDLLNDSIDHLPEEAKRQLEEFLGQEATGTKKRKSWRQRLLYAPTLN